MEKEGKLIPAASIPISKDKWEKSGGLLINESPSKYKAVLERAPFILQEGLEFKEQGKNMPVQDLLLFLLQFPNLTSRFFFKTCLNKGFSYGTLPSFLMENLVCIKVILNPQMCSSVMEIIPF